MKYSLNDKIFVRGFLIFQKLYIHYEWIKVAW